MNKRSPLAGLCLVAMLGAGPALAQSTSADADARMARERAACDGVQQDKAACLREAGAARQEGKRNGLTGSSAAGYDANAMERCKLQPAADQAACEARVRGGAGSSSGGSVKGGGVIRETVTPVPAPSR
ncbi:hypothetical protein J7E62_04985 [Variovorax paradoxus]|nr:hypothetical protein [Variovorax paradoxus]